VQEFDMPNLSNACDQSSPNRAQIAEELYLTGGARDASNRCDINQRLGARDLFAELVRLLRIEPSHIVVDVCCGAGQHVVRFAPLCARAIGYDFSEAAVGEARQRGADAHVADAATLPLPDGSVNAVNCAFGAYYLKDMAAAVAEWQRVLAPRGRIAVCGPARGTNVELYSFHEHATGEGPSDADNMAWGHIEDVVRPALEAAAFTDVSLETFVNPIEFPDAAAFLEYWRSTSLFLRSRRDDITDARLLASRDRVPLRVTKRVLIVSATRLA
jgi:SAM-dependent methyltransferase